MFDGGGFNIFCSRAEIPNTSLGAHHGGHVTTRFLEGFLEGSLKEVLLRRGLRRHLVRISVGTGVPGRVLRSGGIIESA